MVALLILDIKSRKLAEDRTCQLKQNCFSKNLLRESGENLDIRTPKMPGLTVSKGDRGHPREWGLGRRRERTLEAAADHALWKTHELSELEGRFSNFLDGSWKNMNVELPGDTPSLSKLELPHGIATAPYGDRREPHLPCHCAVRLKLT